MISKIAATQKLRMGYMYETKIKLMKGVYRFIKFEIRILLMTLNNKTKLLIKENSKQMELGMFILLLNSV